MVTALTDCPFISLSPVNSYNGFKAERFYSQPHEAAG